MSNKLNLLSSSSSSGTGEFDRSTTYRGCSRRPSVCGTSDRGINWRRALLFLTVARSFLCSSVKGSSTLTENNNILFNRINYKVSLLPALLVWVLAGTNSGSPGGSTAVTSQTIVAKKNDLKNKKGYLTNLHE
jgi:hypothetical protein